MGTLIGSFSLPFWGKQIDRQGSRKMVMLIAFLFGLACIYMGFVQNVLMLGIGFILVRMLGAGSLGLVSQNVMNQWWVRKRGLIMGISGLLMALLGTGVFPSLVYALISTFEWRVAYGVLGLGLLVLMVPAGFVFFRNRFGHHWKKGRDHKTKPSRRHFSLWEGFTCCFSCLPGYRFAWIDCE